MTKNKELQNYVDSQLINIKNYYNEDTTCFPNGYRPSIIDKDNDTYSIACFDCNGYMSCKEAWGDHKPKICNGIDEAKVVIDLIASVPKMDKFWMYAI